MRCKACDYDLSHLGGSRCPECGLAFGLRVAGAFDPEKARCLYCRYALKDLTEHRCPECGSAFDPGDRDSFLHDGSNKGRFGHLVVTAFVAGPVLLMLLLLTALMLYLLLLFLGHGKSW